jgi:hypothetical protein
MARTAIGVVLSLLGATIGAALGVAVVKFLYEQQGLYAMVLPGAALGLGAHLSSPDRSTIRGVIFGIAAVLVGFFAEWYVRPFNADESLGYFVRHIPLLKSWTFLMIGLGGLFGFWWGRERSPWLPRSMQPLQVKGRVEGQHD